MFVVDATALLPCPPDALFEVLAHPEAAWRWRSGVRATRRARRPLAPGAHVLAYHALGREFRLATRLTECERPHLIVYAGRAAPYFDLDVRLSLAPHEGGTRVVYHSALAVRTPGPLAAERTAMCRLVARRAPRDLERIAALAALTAPA